MVLTITQRLIPRLDTLTDEQLVAILDHVLNVARTTQRTDPERETFDFKLTYPPSDNSEIRKDFSSFANTNGGLIIVGIDNSLKVHGIATPPNDVHLRQVLSERNRIRPALEYVVREITYLGVRLVVYQIFESVMPVEILLLRQRRWQTLRRYGSSTTEMSNAEVIMKWYRGLPEVPDSQKLQLDSLALYDVNGNAVNRFVEWKTLNPERLFRLLELPFMPLILVPMQWGIFSTSELYQTTTRWLGKLENITDGLFVELENKIQDIGILSEYWTAPADSPKTLVETHTYRSGINAKALQDSLAELVAKLKYVNFGWAIIAAGISVYVIGGHVSEKIAGVTITHLIPFIPNNFPFVRIDQAARVVISPLPVRPIGQIPLRKWEEPVSSALFLDIPPEDELSKKPTAKITHYLGPKPEERRAGMPIRNKGLMVLSIDMQGRSQLAGMISEIDPVLCRFSTLPMGLNDAQEIKVVGHKGTAFLFPDYDFHDFHLVLFDLDCDVNQSKSLKL